MFMTNRSRFAAVFIGAILIAPSVARPAAFQQKSSPDGPYTLEDFRAGDAIRERYQRATDLLNAMELSRGDWTAEVGAGDGYYPMRLCDLVGPAGKVFAEDISDRSTRWMNRRVEVFGLSNVEVIKGEVADPKLPAGSLAGVLVVNSYHHFAEYPAMNRQILRALKPGGRLVVADYISPEHRSLSREEQLKHHEIDPDLVQSEVERAGFQVLRIENPFLKRMPEVANGNNIARSELWMMVAVRPK
jgi:predicted methyltransferase